MRKTFEEVIQDYFDKNYDSEYFSLSDIGYDDCLKLMKLVREQSLIEVAGKAEAD